MKPLTCLLTCLLVYAANGAERDSSKDWIEDRSRHSFIIIDNSSSMMGFGRNYTPPSGRDFSQNIEITHLLSNRWMEQRTKLLDVMKYNLHRDMPTTLFRLDSERGLTINPNTPNAMQVVKDWYDDSRYISYTPLTSALSNVMNSDDFQRSHPHPISLVIFTDGVPETILGVNDRTAFTANLVQLGYSRDVHIVVNLCTNTDKTVKFWNDLDRWDVLVRMVRATRSTFDVVDDPLEELTDIKLQNPWLKIPHCSYVAKMAGGCKEMDLLDERLMLGNEIHAFLKKMTAVFPPDTIRQLENARDYTTYRRILENAQRTCYERQRGTPEGQFCFHMNEFDRLLPHIFEVLHCWWQNVRPSDMKPWEVVNSHYCAKQVRGMNEDAARCEPPTNLFGCRRRQPRHPHFE